MDSSKRGIWSLTDKGRATHLSAEEARGIFLKWVRIFAEERKKKKKKKDNAETEDEAPDTTLPQTADYRKELLALLLRLSPPVFERLCERLLRESGFVQVMVTGRSGDGDLDGHGTYR